MNFASKKFLIPMAAVAVIGAGVYGVTQVSADSTSANTDPRASLIQKLSDTFKLDKSKVQEVFDQDMKDRQAEREKNYEERLTQAVKDGKLTEDQKSKVLAEYNKLKAEIEEQMKNTSATKEERRAAMDKIRDEAEAWAKANNIDAKWLMAGGPHLRGMGPGMGRGMMGGHHGMDDDGPRDSGATQAQ